MFFSHNNNLVCSHTNHIQPSSSPSFSICQSTAEGKFKALLWARLWKRNSLYPRYTNSRCPQMCLLWWEPLFLYPSSHDQSLFLRLSLPSVVFLFGSLMAYWFGKLFFAILRYIHCYWKSVLRTTPLTKACLCICLEKPVFFFTLKEGGPVLPPVCYLLLAAGDASPINGSSPTTDDPAPLLWRLALSLARRYCAPPRC